MSLSEPSGAYQARHYRIAPDGRVVCEVCPRFCRLRPGQRGFCFVRVRPRDARSPTLHLTTYGRSSGLCIDPIEKKPLAHFLPGTPVLSLGTAGCNLACKFCQNWETSRARAFDDGQVEAPPHAVALAAAATGCRSVALTYNDPTIFLEYAVDIAREAHAYGIAAVAVTAGSITAPAREDLYAHMDAANVDLKAFTEAFYRRMTGGHLEPVKETLVWIARQGRIHLEVTTLLIPGHNDSEREVRALAAWIGEHLGPSVPLHFSAFHPDFRLLDVPPTPPRTLRQARAWARAEGLWHVYTGNVHDREGDTTFCPGCGAPLIVRDWYEVLEYHLDPEGRCPGCARPLEGVFDAEPGRWGRRRQPVALRRRA
ncbi:MAG: AmmeMemoRadiSam system radical SAM enzyme [Deltaproteobacteria bacterium]|nr:MAG: AmmeMemoRadiSam system radical SAM enzyme [Deltaproteobacteria bacterium]